MPSILYACRLAMPLCCIAAAFCICLSIRLYVTSSPATAVFFFNTFPIKTASIIHICVVPAPLHKPATPISFIEANFADVLYSLYILRLSFFTCNTFSPETLPEHLKDFISDNIRLFI